MDAVDTVSKELYVLKNIVCKIQSSFSQYMFFANQKQRALRNAVDSYKSYKENLIQQKAFSEHRSKSLLISEIEECIVDLEYFLLLGFHEIFKETHRLLVPYFQNRSSLSPRWCIKVISHDYMLTLFRMPETTPSNFRFSPYQNTAFKEILKGSSCFLSNNIPKDVHDGKYENARIDTDKAKQYFKSRSGVSSSQSFDSNWSQCWKLGEPATGNNEQRPDSFYKSTLVIPMSLKTEDLAKDFINQFKIDDSKQRAIFGFSCMDHISTNFFQEQDFHILGILTDLFSLYLIKQIMYTQYSSQYYEASYISQMHK